MLVLAMTMVLVSDFGFLILFVEGYDSFYRMIPIYLSSKTSRKLEIGL